MTTPAIPLALVCIGAAILAALLQSEHRAEPSIDDILARLRRIDWLQFEGVIYLLLQSEGWKIEKHGGPNPDHGADLIATRSSKRMVVQCKHWASWDVPEKTIRELIGTGVIFSTTHGALYASGTFTEPALKLAAQQSIETVNGRQIAERIQKRWRHNLQAILP